MLMRRYEVEMSGHILHDHPLKQKHTLFQNNKYQLYLTNRKVILVKQQDTAIWLALQDENSAKRQKTSEYEAYVSDSHVRTFNEEELDYDEIQTKHEQDIIRNCEHQYQLNHDEEFLAKGDIVGKVERNSCLFAIHKDHPRVQAVKEILNSTLSQIISRPFVSKKKFGPEKSYCPMNTSLSRYSWARRGANECIVSITEPDYKNLNKNDIEDMYLLIMNGKVPDYAETGLLWSLSVFIRSSVIWERVHDFQLGIESYQQKVNLTAPTISFPGKVLEGLKSYNNDVKYGYVQRELTNDEVEYLKLFEEEIEVRLKHRNQMRRWEIKDTEDPSWSTSFKTRSTQKTSSALEALWKTLFVLYFYLIGTLNGYLRKVSIPNDIYNSVDACTSAKDMWKRVELDTFDDLFDYLQQFEKLVNVSRAKKLEKSHDPLALQDEDEYQQDDVHANSEDPLTSAMLLLARAITQNFSTPTNNHLRTLSNTRNQSIIQGDRVIIQSRNSDNAGRNNRRAYVQEEIVEGSNALNETGNVQRTLRTSSSGNTSTDEAGVILTNEENDFFFADASRIEEIKELSVNICLMARIQPADNNSDAGPRYDSAFISEVQYLSNTENEEQMYP
ncbi:hypothetical protein Tco_0570750 [Tanacetum coccineum]